MKVCGYFFDVFPGFLCYYAKVIRGIDEKELARLCSERNIEAENELYTRYAASLLTLCRRYTGSIDDAKDLMQDSIITALDKISTYTYTGTGSLYAWISRIAVNAALNRIKRNRFIPLDTGLLRKAAEPDSAVDEDLELFTQEALLEMISSLPKVQRAVFNMYCLDGFSHKEIAGELGISERGSSGLLAKARTNLRLKLAEYLKKHK